MNIKDVYVNFIQYGNKSGKNIVLLHGWGQNIEMMDPIGKRLQKDFYITIIDLPGFGKSSEPTYGYTVYDYFEIVDELLRKLKIKNPIMIGHSFGGRISIIYAAKKGVEKLVLLASPFKRSVKKNTFKIKLLKFLKKVPVVKELESYMKTKIGSRDYRNATPIMRLILVNTVNEDLTEYLKQIELPTLLIWGDLDTEAPLEDAKYAETIMKDAGLIIYQGATHYAYLERINEVINVLNVFLKEGKK
jgi:pimeloyl-ACP methyl ester carboxylesterase